MTKFIEIDEENEKQLINIEYIYSFSFYKDDDDNGLLMTVFGEDGNHRNIYLPFKNKKEREKYYNKLKEMLGVNDAT
jgi:hypothetical protein